MPRPPLPVGTWGSITVDQPRPGRYRARARFRDYDGHTRQVERTGRTRGAARAALTAYFTERTAPAGEELTASTRLHVVAAVWQAEAITRYDAGDLAENTLRRYLEVLTGHVLPALGGLTVAECTVSRVDRFLKATAEQTGAPTAKLCRTILTGVLGLAVRHGAATANPVRDAAPVTVAHAEPRALTVDEIRTMRDAIRRWQHGDPVTGRARRGRPPTQDLLDVVDVMLATGARVGEVLALRWEDVDLERGTVTVSGTIVAGRERPRKLRRQTHPKSSTSRRRLSLPPFAVDALMRRRLAVVVANVHDVVFPSTNGTLRDPAVVRKQLDKVLEPVGLGWVSPHTFRRTVATVLDRHADLRTAADQLGHAGTDVTRRHYVEQTHQGPDARAILARLG